MTEPLVEDDNLYRICTVQATFKGLKSLPARPVYSPVSANEIRDVMAYVREGASALPSK